MSAEVLAAGTVQIVGGVALAPLLPGLIQSFKARLQGRRGPSPLQPYRALRRLWSRSRVTPQPHSLVYDMVPLVSAASVLLIMAMLPVASTAPDWRLGNDAFVVVGLLALGRFALALAAWDTGSGFALMGVARDLTFAVIGEALLLVVLVLLALPAGSTDLVAMSASAADGAGWAAAAGWAIVALAETGRQPIDNPDTHLELTMVHEGPLLEYAGRDLALLQWTAAARHWIVLVLIAELALPHPGPFGAQLVALGSALAVLAPLLAIVETAQAKMRILRVPLLLGGGLAICLMGLAASLLGVSA